MKKADREKIIRVGDKVKIINPEFFVGCYYDNNLKDTMDEVYEKYEIEIRRFIIKTLSGKDDHRDDEAIRTQIMMERPSKAVEYIAKGLAYELVGRRIKEGNERKIHTCLLPEYQNNIFEVTDIQYCQTGFFDRGYYSPGSYFEPEGEYIPNGLTKIKVHKILTIFLANSVHAIDDEGMKIETIHVEKVKKCEDVLGAGSRFEINEYDGSESIHVIGDREYLIA